MHAADELYVIDTTGSQPARMYFARGSEESQYYLLDGSPQGKGNFKVDFAVGRADDSCFGGIFHTPIQLVFDDNLWNDPM